MKIRKTVRAIILDLTARILLIQHKDIWNNQPEGFATLVSLLLRNEFPETLVLLVDLDGRDI